MRVPGLPKLVKHHGRRQQGRHRRGRPVSESRWQLVGGVAAVVTLAAVWNAPLPDRPAAGGYNASVPAAVDPFIEDEILAEFVEPEQLDAVPVGPGQVAKPVQMVLAGAPVIRTLGESGIPDVAVRAYKQAEARLAVSDPGCGVPWTLLAAIGRVESNHGRFGGAQLRNDGSATRRIRGIPLDGRPNVALIRDTDGGALDGDTVYDRAVGPMQFIPSTWRAVNADGNGDGFGDPNNMFDAAQGAAQYLCTGTSNLRDPARAAQAVRRYNNAASYVRVVLDLARMYQSGRITALPTAGDALPDDPAGPPAARSWPADPPVARPWTVDPPAARPTDPQPDDTVLAKPAPTQRTKPSAPPQAVSPPRTTPLPPTTPRPATTPTGKPSPTTPSKPPAVQPPQPQPTTTPTAPKPTQTQPSTPTRPSGPKPTTTPAPTEPDTSQPSKPRPTVPQPSQPKATEPEPSESNSPTPAPSATPSPAPSAERTPAQKPTTAAIGWAPAMRQVVGRALSRPTCPQTPNEAGQPRAPRQPTQPSTPCPDDSATPPPSRDDKNRKQCTPQTACKPPAPRR
ncbi:hypothetical protein ACGFIF_12000 [Kribbella sp. NPDC049174]|uniref:lytic transglycosylase domain-containing protein n=1 Tax=Kribbella sp. NPDC049174 TaxID=3364112 RepID=UPI003713BB46